MGHVTADSELFATKNGEICLHPTNSLEDQMWYFGTISEKEAEDILLNPANESGTFLVRKAGHGNKNYFLSIREGSGLNNYFVSHRRIQKNGSEGFVILSSPYETVNELVERGQNGKQTFGASFNLQYPCSKSKYVVVSGAEDSISQCETDRESVKMERRIGEGSMGEVWKGNWNGIDVAVRKVKKENINLDDFIDEAKQMKKLSHENVLSLHAVCIKEDPFYIILEYLIKGTLRRVLTQDRGRTLQLAQLLNFARQVATGMEYLESFGLVHRGLAARTILVGEGFVCKIGDFGLANIVKEGRYYCCNLAFIYRWAAPEVIKSTRYTCKSDVWSYGIVVMEILTYGQTLYKGMRNRDLLTQIEGGHRMAKPANCPDDVYNELLRCWNLDPLLRPTFGELRTFFDKYQVQLDAQDCNNNTNNPISKTGEEKGPSVRAKIRQQRPIVNPSRKSRGMFPKEASNARSYANVDYSYEPTNGNCGGGKRYYSRTVVNNNSDGYRGYRGNQLYGGIYF